MNSTYKRIEKLCKENNTDITKMCRELKIPRSSLSELKMERVKNISADKVAKIADYFGVSALYITDGIESGSPEPVDETELAKVALFGGDVKVSDEMWNEAKQFAEYLKHKYNNK